MGEFNSEKDANTDPSSAVPAPPAKARPASEKPEASLWGFILPTLALAISLGVWYRLNTEIDQVRSSQRDLMTEVSALRKSAIIDITGAPARGASDAVVTLIEFSDYECPYCIRHFQQTMPKIDAAYIQTGKVRYAFRDFPVDQLHPVSIKAHEAAHCAAAQNKFWDLHMRLFSQPGSHTTEALQQRASEAGLDLSTYKTCVAAAAATDQIRASATEAMELGASGTPAFFLGLRDLATNQVRVRQTISGAQSFDVFASALDKLIKQ